MPNKQGTACALCGAQAHARHLCAKHYYRLLRNGTQDLSRFEDGMTPEAKFRAVMGDQPPADGCWDWLGPVSGVPADYGVVKSRIHGDRSAHRLSYEMFVGPIPPGLEVLHSCDRKVCVQPCHLSPGTHAENMRQASERGRLRRQK